MHTERHVLLSSRHAVDKTVPATQKLEGPDNFIVNIKVVCMLNYESTGGAELQLQEFLIAKLGWCEEIKSCGDRRYVYISTNCYCLS
jgi:hypothetical protein